MSNGVQGLCKPMLKALAFMVIAVASTETFRWVDGQFRYGNIAYDPRFFSSLETSAIPENIIAKLHQSYRYLDRGKQSFAFVSDDGQYVLKFFDVSRLRRWSDKKAAAKKIRQVVAGYFVADKYDKDHVGLLYLQLQPIGGDSCVVSLKDRFGFTHAIDLSRVPFILQKKAVPTRVVISRYLDRGDVVSAKEAFDKILAMYADEHQRGVYDGDHNVMHNTGFVDGEPLRIDAGRLTLDEGVKDPVRSQNEIGKIREERMKTWLQRHRYGSVDLISSD